MPETHKAKSQKDSFPTIEEMFAGAETIEGLAKLVEQGRGTPMIHYTAAAMERVRCEALQKLMAGPAPK